MGWFVLAAILGFAAPKAWRTLGPAGRRGMAIAGAAIVGVAIITIGPWLLFRASSNTASLSVDWINDPAFTRVLLGLILGAGADYVSRERQPAGQTGDQPSLAGDQRPPSAVSLSLAAGIVVLAAVAPHVDDWLSHLSGLKTSLIEIQLTGLSSTSKAVKPAQRENFVREFALNSLTEIDTSITLDIRFIEEFQLKDIRDRWDEHSAEELGKEERRLQAQLEQLRKLKDFFESTVAPAARCFKIAIDHGLSLERARYHLRELADELTQLILLEQEEKRRPETVKERSFQIETHDWRAIYLLAKATNDVGGFVDPTEQKICHPAPVIAPIPHSTDYNLLPHLDVARALLLVFVNHDHLGIEVLRGASQKEFKDFNTPYVLAQLMFYRGDSITQYYDSLEGLRKLSRDRIDIIDRVNRACRSVCDHELLTEKLKQRAQRADLVATNAIAYAIAVDVAEGRSAAEDLLPIAEQYVEVLKKTASNLEKPQILDTIGFATIVAEANRGKTSGLNKAKISEALDLLSKAAAHEETDLSSQSASGEDVDYSSLRTIRGHLSSARGLLE